MVTVRVDYSRTTVEGEKGQEEGAVRVGENRICLSCLQVAHVVEMEAMVARL